MQNIADLKNPNDLQGRTYREINNATKHNFSFGDLVEIESGVRLVITRLSRDCDGTPLYWLGLNVGYTVSRGHPEDGIKLIKSK